MGKTWNGVWHCNPETGNVGRCYAHRKDCPFPEDYHGSSPNEALETFEKAQEPEKLIKFSKGRPKIKEFSIDDAEVFPLFSSTASVPDLPRLGVESIEKLAAGRKVSCPECGKVLGGAKPALTALHMETWGNAVYCVNCEEMVDNTSALVEPNVNSATYGAMEPENVKKMTWYHFSENPQWNLSVAEADEDDLKFIHLGGEVAAADRASSNGNSDSPYYLFVVTVNEDASVDEHVDQDDSVDYNPSGSNDVYRYLNRYEDIGSISLAVNPKKISVIGRAKFDRKLVDKVGTYKINPTLTERTVGAYNRRYTGEKPLPSYF